MKKHPNMKPTDPNRLDEHLHALRLPWMRENLETLAATAAKAK